MKDSGPRAGEADEPRIPRPRWQFSGRRGVPVHRRDRATDALPREIQRAVIDLARERVGRDQAEQAATAAAPHEPPVAAAAIPVERRSGSEERAAGDDVATTSPDEVPAAPPLEQPAEPARPKRRRLFGIGRAAEDTPPAIEPLMATTSSLASDDPAAPEPTPTAGSGPGEDEPELPIDVPQPPEPQPALAEPQPAHAEPQPAHAGAEVGMPASESVEPDPPAVSSSPVFDAPQPDPPPPSAGLDSAGQAAWELGRAPILTEQLRGLPAREDADSTEPAPAEAPEPAAASRPEPIALLDEPLFPPRDQRGLRSIRRGEPADGEPPRLEIGTSRAEARRRIQSRRARLEALVSDLAQLSADDTDR